MPKLLLKWLLLLTGAISLLYVIALVAGTLLPARIEARRIISINRPPENVWWVLTDYTNMALWHPQYKSAAPVSNPGDKPMRWRAIYTDGLAATVEVWQERYPTFLAERISDPKLPFSGNWKVDLLRKDLTSQVTVQSSVELRKPFDRLFVRLFVRPEAELDRILNSLKRRVESTTIKPTPATS
jgi:Polyketide cyclase / dehydrase and lipid transport